MLLIFLNFFAIANRNGKPSRRSSLLNNFAFFPYKILNLLNIYLKFHSGGIEKTQLIAVLLTCPTTIKQYEIFVCRRQRFRDDGTATQPKMLYLTGYFNLFPTALLVQIQTVHAELFSFVGCAAINIQLPVSDIRTVVISGLRYFISTPNEADMAVVVLCLVQEIDAVCLKVNIDVLLHIIC